MPPAVPAIVPEVDGLRGGCALLIAVFHTWFWGAPAPLDGAGVRALVAAGHLAVDYFFVLSGFVLFLPVVRNRGAFGDVRAYAARRAVRILPAYYAALIVQAFVLLPLLTGESVWSGGALVVLGLHFFFLSYEVPSWWMRHFGYSGGMVGFGINGAFWSLTVEACYYVALPLIAVRYARRPLFGLLVGLVVALAWRWLAYHLPSLGESVGAQGVAGGSLPRLVRQLPGYAGHFALGMTAAYVFATLHAKASRARAHGDGGTALTPRISAVVALVGLAGVVLAMLLAGADQSDGPLTRYCWDIAAAFAFALLLTGVALAPPGLQWPLSNPVARWLGDVSYGMYLWHTPLILAIAHALRVARPASNADFVRLLALALPATVAAGWLSRRLIESPALGWVHVRLARRT